MPAPLSSTNPERYYPPAGALPQSRDGLFGLRVGTTFDTHAQAYAALAKDGFDAPPVRKIGEHQQFALSRRVAGKETSAALYVLYDDKGQLRRVALAFGGEPCDSEPEAAASAKKLYEFLTNALGPENILLERIERWAEGPALDTGLELACAAAWVAGEGHGHQEVFDAEDFAQATSEFDGPRLMATISTIGDKVVALLTAELPAEG